VRGLADDPARKIEAIKAYREETGAGLAKAKAAVEAYINGR
jgi:ribosomal protein L7/L12